MDVEQVRWVAHLSRIHVADAELPTLAGELTTILAYVDQLSEVDTAHVEPMAHPCEVTSVFRDDEPAGSLSPDEALANAPARRGDFFGVPPILD